jgi:hypothetical protein
MYFYSSLTSGPMAKLLGPIDVVNHKPHPCFANHIFDGFQSALMPEESEDPQCNLLCPGYSDDLDSAVHVGLKVAELMS